MNIKYLDADFLNTLSTTRLLNYYKKTYKKIRQHQDSLYCECCGMPEWETDAGLYTDEENKKRELDFQNDIDNTENYLTLIKSILNKRENVKIIYKSDKRKPHKFPKKNKKLVKRI